MTPLLKSITLSNFRSISGTVTVPLDAPVVLIYGQNGAGKTSILSGLELALTGSIPSLARYDSNYVSYLVNKGTDRGHVEVLVEGVDGAADSAKLTLTAGRISGQGLLARDRARFYSERCFLAQATLGRLLEIYESKDIHAGESPLTRFVKDLLGLDHLDALIDGLHDAGDVRRLRTSVPRYWQVRDRVPELESEIQSDSGQLNELDAAIQDVDATLAQQLNTLGPEYVVAGESNLPTLLMSDAEDQSLQQLARVRRDIAAIREQWLSLQPPGVTNAYEKSEEHVAAAKIAVDRWTADKGTQLRQIFARLRVFFPDVGSNLSSVPDEAVSAALQIVQAEIKRCNQVLTEHAAEAERLVAIEQGIQRASARIAALEGLIAHEVSESSTLAYNLAELLPHIDSNDCPVCGRDFSEVSAEPLHAHLSRRISSLTESAGRLEALTRERNECSKSVSDGERQHAAIAALHLPDAALDEVKTRRARLVELHRELAEIGPAAIEGSRLIYRLAEKSTELKELQSRDQVALAIRDSTAKFAVSLSLDPLGEAEGVERALERLHKHVLEREATLTRRQLVRRNALSHLRDLQELKKKRAGIDAAIRKRRASCRDLAAAQKLADEQVMQARDLAKRAKDTRADIVRRVFNDSLNAVWRDLFVRLAPDEPFVPAFALPDTQGGTVEAVLETWYRAGGKGGNPRAMLSAGNLNTAALTLYLALHLSVAPTLPWLVIDDPVQSMDEVHVAQFAALLRTLSKQLKRQILIAVHERPLFDYLALELSPAFKNDRLITIEIGRSPIGSTVVTYEPKTWDPDSAVAA